MHRDNFKYLLIALLIFIVVLPVAHDLGFVSLQVGRFVAVSSLLAIGVSSLRGNSRLFIAGMCLAVAGIVLSFTSLAGGNDLYYLLSQAMLFVFLGLASFNNLRQVAAGNDISANRIIGAICVYLMLGVMWSIAYSVLEYSLPGSFAGIDESAESAWDQGWVYFSFVTITTLGYGDLLPLSTTARSLALAEAVVGQFYIAILVAGLVSAYISAKPGAPGQD